MPRYLTSVILLIAGVGVLLFAVETLLHRGNDTPPIIVEHIVPTPPASPSPSPPPTVPVEYQSLLTAAADTCSQVPKMILAAQIKVESNWDPQAVSHAGAKGIAQFIPSTWKAYSVDGDGDGKKNVWNPADAIPSAAAYNCALLKNVRNVPGDPIVNMLAAYNAGPGAVIKYHGVPPFPETQNYVDKVIMTKEILVPF